MVWMLDYARFLAKYRAGIMKCGLLLEGFETAEQRY